MPKKKLPWRTLAEFDGPTGRITREQADRAVLEVKAAREAQKAQARKHRRAASATKRVQLEGGTSARTTTSEASF